MIFKIPMVLLPNLTFIIPLTAKVKGKLKAEIKIKIQIEAPRRYQNRFLFKDHSTFLVLFYR
jgi:hypothetical protein